MRTYIRDMMLDALKRNEYKKGRIQLHAVTGEFCALGVLCDLYRQCTNQGKWVEFKDGPRVVRMFMFDHELPEVNPNRLVNAPAVVTDWADMSDLERNNLMSISDWGTYPKDPNPRPLKPNFTWTAVIAYLETL